MPVLTAAQTAQLARLAGEAFKTTRMLTDDDLDTIASESALMVDPEGVAPGGTGYVNTVDIYRAAAEAWLTKASMVADGFDFESEGASFTRSQMFDQYSAQATRMMQRAAQMSAGIGRPVEDEAPVDAFEEWLEGGGGLP